MAESTYSQPEPICRMESSWVYDRWMDERSFVQTKDKAPSIWLYEATEISRISWEEFIQKPTPTFIQVPPQKQMTALEVIMRRRHWVKPLGGMLAIGARIIPLPFSVGPVDYSPGDADPYAALCGCCRAVAGFAATECLPDKEWKDDP